MWRLDHLATFERPAGLPNEEWRCYGLRARGLVGILRDPATLELFELGGDALRSLHSFCLPLGERREIAVHPTGRQLAVAVPEGVHLLYAPDGDTLALEADRLGGAPRGVIFDRHGELLWATYEDDDGMSHAAVVDVVTLEVLGRVPLGGVAGSFHALELHPTWEAVSVEVSCGSEGSWLTFVECRDRSFRPLIGLEPAFSMAGFGPHGRWLATLVPDRLQLLSWPDMSELAIVPPPSDRAMFDWLATFVGERFLGTTFTPEAKAYHLALYSAELELEGLMLWEKADQEFLFDLAGLPADHVLVFGDRRAGLFQLRCVE